MGRWYNSSLGRAPFPQLCGLPLPQQCRNKALRQGKWADVRAFRERCPCSVQVTRELRGEMAGAALIAKKVSVNSRQGSQTSRAVTRQSRGAARGLEGSPNRREWTEAQQSDTPTLALPHTPVGPRGVSWVGLRPSNQRPALRPALPAQDLSQ